MTCNRTCLEGSLNETLVIGKVVLCFQSRSIRSATTVARTIKKLQGVGLIFAQFPAKDVVVSSIIPCVQVDFELGTHLLAYMVTTRYYIHYKMLMFKTLEAVVLARKLLSRMFLCNVDLVQLICCSSSMIWVIYCRYPVVKLSKTKTVVGQQISPEVAFFSSRGPSSLSPTVLKVLPMVYVTYVSNVAS